MNHTLRRASAVTETRQDRGIRGKLDALTSSLCKRQTTSLAGLGTHRSRLIRMAPPLCKTQTKGWLQGSLGAHLAGFRVRGLSDTHLPLGQDGGRGVPEVAGRHEEHEAAREQHAPAAAQVRPLRLLVLRGASHSSVF